MFERDGASQHNPDSMNPDSIRPDEISDPSGGWGPLADAVGSCDALTAQAADLAADVFASLRMMETVNSSLPTGCRESIAAKLSVAAARLAHAAQRLHVAAVGVAASEQVHHRDGVTTIAYWVALHHGLTRRDAQRLLRAGLTTERYEQVRASFEAGDITLGHVDAISSIIPDRYTGERLDAAIDAVRDIEPLLLGTASRCSLNQFERFCRSIRDRLDQDGPSDPNAEPSRISLSRTFNGRWHLNGDLTADDGAIVATILHDLINRQARDNTNDTTPSGTTPSETTSSETTAGSEHATAAEPEAGAGEAGAGEAASDEPAPETERGPTMPERRASAFRDALIAAAGITRPGRAGVYVHIDLDKLNRADEGLARLFSERHGEPDVSGPAHTETNLDITDETLWALLADADVTPTFTRNGTPLSYGQTRRLAPDILRRVLSYRDRGCRFPGCERDTVGCDVHHIVHFNDEGPTDPANLTHLCRFHHSLHHRGGAVISGAPNERHRAVRPDGTTITNTPRYL